MSKFNTKSTGTKTVNLAGGEAFQESPELEFISILLTSFVQDQYYRSASDGIKRVKELVKSCDKEFCAKSAIYARNEFGMRSISHVVAGEIAKHVKGKEWTKRFFDKVVFRVDDITEILSYYMGEYKKPLPNSLKKGLAKAFDKFSPYQLAKYRGEGKQLSLVDAVNLLHPKPFNGNEEALKQLVNGELVSKDTWESELTKAGQNAENAEDKAEKKKDVWVKLIKEKKIGYFALLRNLRNILEQAPEIVPEAITMLTDRKLIKKSLVLPFRFATAVNEISKTSFEGSRAVVMALNEALDISVDNVPKLDGKTLVVLDVSGSMGGGWYSAKDGKSPAEIGGLFSAILVKSNDADFMTFDTRGVYQTMNPMDSTLTLANNINYRGGGTDFRLPFTTANKAYDRIIILSDMQGWVGYHSPQEVYRQYKSRHNCDPHVYMFDLQGYGSLQLPERNVYCLAGFSDKVFDVMKYLEQDKNALVNTINQVEL